MTTLMLDLGYLPSRRGWNLPGAHHVGCAERANSTVYTFTEVEPAYAFILCVNIRTRVYGIQVSCDMETYTCAWMFMVNARVCLHIRTS